jgi:hypothetical protein
MADHLGMENIDKSSIFAKYASSPWEKVKRLNAWAFPSAGGNPDNHPWG